MCRMFTISNLNELEREGALKGRLKYITATVKYNESDWSYGWNQHIDGLTLYISDELDEVINEANGMKLNLDNIGYVDFNRLHTKLLGKPYTNCKAIHTKTTYFQTYSRDHCLFECLAKWIEDKCGCIPALFPSKTG